MGFAFLLRFCIKTVKSSSLYCRYFKLANNLPPLLCFLDKKMIFFFVSLDLQRFVSLIMQQHPH